MDNNKPTDFSDKNTNTSKVELFQNNNSNIIIIILVIFLILSLLGVNFLLMLGGFLDNVINGIKYYVLQFLSMIGFYTGAVINTSADIVGDTAKGGIDIAEGTVQSIGNLLQNRDNMNGPSLEQNQWNLSVFGWNPTPKESDSSVQNPEQIAQSAMNSVSPYIDSSVDKMNALNSKILNFADEINEKGTELQQLDEEINQRKQLLSNMPSDNYSSSSVNWCPVGYENNQGQCITIGKDDKCMYGKVFSTKEECEENVQQPAFSGYNYQDKSINWGTPPPPPPPAALAQKPLPPCPQIPGMCMNQRPMCGPQKQLPMQMQTIPSRGQIQNGDSPNALQQQQQQLPPLPTFPQQPSFPEQQQQQQQQNSPDSSNGNQSQYVDPIPGSSSSNNFAPATPADGSGMIINVTPAPAVAPMPGPTVSPAPSVSPMPLPSITPSVAPAVSPAVVPVTPSDSKQCDNHDHHHHPHSHDGNFNISPGANVLDSSKSVDLTGLETDINSLNSVVKNLKTIQTNNDPKEDKPVLTPAEEQLKQLLQT
jgi:hypothetical protein